MVILGPPLCLGIVIGFASNFMRNLNKKALKRIELRKDFVLLDVLHHFTSGLKAFTTE
jgi:hypothetical protein